MATEVENNSKGAENYILEPGLDEDYLYSMIDKNDEKQILQNNL